MEGKYEYWEEDVEFTVKVKEGLCDVCCEPISECECTDADFREAYGEY